MTVQLKSGTVVDRADPTNTGIFYAQFDAPDPEPVKYVSPYGSPTTGAFVAIPDVGSQILVLYEDNVNEKAGTLAGYYYLGSVMSSQPGFNRDIADADLLAPPTLPKGPQPYVPTDKEGMAGPPIPDAIGLGGTPPVPPRLLDDSLSQKSFGPWPLALKGMYQAKAVIPQQISMSNEDGDALMLSSRQNSTTESDIPFQDHRVALSTVKGKRLQLVDSPIINGLTYSNEHKGKDFLIWCSKSNVNSPFSEGEFHLRTHGPINMYTLWSGFHLWVQDGKNLTLENKSSDSKAYMTEKNPRGSDGRVGEKSDEYPDGKPMSGLGSPGEGGYKDTRKGKFGNQTTGCIDLLSHHNNITLKAMNPDSVIYINTPGPDSRIIIDSAGSLDINAEKKLTLQSGTKLEINAPTVDINGTEVVDIHGAQILLNKPNHRDNDK